MIEGANGEEGGGIECGIINDAVIHPPQEGDEDEDCKEDVNEGAQDDKGGGVERGKIEDAVIHPPDESDEDEDCGFSGGDGADGCPGRRHGYPGILEGHS